MVNDTCNRARAPQGNLVTAPDLITAMANHHAAVAGFETELKENTP
jgi:hypothetical protein